LLVAIENLNDPKADYRLIEEIVTKFAKPASVIQVRNSPLTALVELTDIEDSLRTKEGLVSNKELVREGIINVTFVSEKLIAEK